jgi:glutathione-regulated potassium-efflux system ancillary protein KefF
MSAPPVEPATGAPIVVVQAHPYPDRSRANRALAEAIDGLPGLDIRILYDLYPDFSIDVAAEQRALEAASIVVWQHPIYWYTAPALLKLWFEKVLTAGWAYGPDGIALRGKRCLWVVTTGGTELDYMPSGVHQHVFDMFAAVVRQTAQFCGMIWLEPLVVHGAPGLDEAELQVHGRRYRAYLTALLREEELQLDA